MSGTSRRMRSMRIATASDCARAGAVIRRMRRVARTRFMRTTIVQPFAKFTVNSRQLTVRPFISDRSENTSCTLDMQSIAVRVLEGYSMKLSKRALVRIVPVTVVLILVACGVTSVTGPTAVTIGQNATYDYAWSYGTTVGDPSSATNGTAEITVQIPNGWTVVSATYN